MRIAMALLVASVAFGSACKKKETSGEAGQGSAPVAGSGDMGSAGSAAADTGSAAAGSGEGSAAGSDQTMARRGGNCPSTVFGSTTTATLEDGNVVVTITSDDKDAVGAIQRRTEERLKGTGEGAGAGTGHDAKGTHGGTIGLCPLHLGEGGTATSKVDAKGVVVTITPKASPEALKTEIDARIVKAADWVKANLKEGDQGTTGGVGGGAGEHGSNHSGEGDAKGKERKDGSGAGSGGDGKGGGKGTGGGGGAGTGGGSSNAGSAAK